MSIFEQFFDAPKFDFDKEKKKFIDNMDYLKSMSVQEQTLYKKWVEVQNYSHLLDRSQVVKAKIWKPRDITNKETTLEDINNLKPKIKFVPIEDRRAADEWLMLRIFCHTMSFDQNPGRFLRYLIYDEVTGKYLGATSIGSDVISITCRDKWIGWTGEQKLKQGLLRNSAIGTCIMSTQPFGYNFLGGKFTASILLTKPVKDSWYSLYNDVLVGMTTTSLYGTESMYNSIPFWKKVGASKGKIALKADDRFYDIWHQWIKENYKDEYDKKMEQKEGVSGPVTGAKQRGISMIFRAVGIKPSQYMHGFERGVYYAPIYSNTKEFLTGKISEKELIISPKLKNDLDSVMEWWKPKAINRYQTLHLENKLKPDILYYNDMIGIDWDEAKKKYLKEVGR